MFECIKYIEIFNSYLQLISWFSEAHVSFSFRNSENLSLLTAAKFKVIEGIMENSRWEGSESALKYICSGVHWKGFKVAHSQNNTLYTLVAWKSKSL